MAEERDEAAFLEVVLPKFVFRRGTGTTELVCEIIPEHPSVVSPHVDELSLADLLGFVRQHVRKYH